MIDTHCHIDLYDRPLEIAADAERLAVRTIAVTYLPSHFELACKHLAGFRFIRPALGLHPLAVKEHELELKRFSEHFTSTKYVGEVGLDFSGANKSSRVAQERSFAMVICHLQRERKFTTVHSRGAEDVTLDMLRNGNVGPVVFHWFSGTKRQLTKLLDEGHLISINTAMSVSPKWAEMITYVPRAAVLTETDGPFIKVGRRHAVPADVKLVISWLATCWNVSAETAMSQVMGNFKRLVKSL